MVLISDSIQNHYIRVSLVDYTSHRKIVSANCCYITNIIPSHVYLTSSRQITEVKQRWARLVPGWVTTLYDQ